MTVSEYSIIRASDAADLTPLVKSAIRDGWQPLGGVAVAVVSVGQSVWAQAMVR